MEYVIVVVGAGAVGKSAITVRFINGTFVQKYDPTIEDSYRKQVEIDGKACILDIMDTAGQEEYSALRDQYMKSGDGFVLVYSITSQFSFEYTNKLRQSIFRTKDEQQDIPIMLVGNKCDLEADRAISLEDGQKLADQWGTGFVEASAKVNKNVSHIFYELVRMVDKWREKYPNKLPQDKQKTSKTRTRGFSCSLL